MATSTLGSGTLVLAGTTSGTTTVTATAVAGTTTLTLPAATDTLVGKATTDTLTNKTLTGAAMNGTLGATTPSTVAATTISASSTATFAAGAVGTPSITTSGDTNTGIFFPAADTIAFAEGGVEAARFDSSGNLLVGSSSTIGTGGVFQITSSTDTSLFKCTSSTTYAAIVSNVENTAARLIAFQYGSGGSPTNVGAITTNGTVVVYGGTSDYRLKTVIGAVTGHGERIDALEPIEYTWNSNGSHTRGFLAHKFQEIYADSVTGTKDDVDADGNPVYQSMQAATSEVIADLVAEIQSLRKRLAALESA